MEATAIATLSDQQILVSKKNTTGAEAIVLALLAEGVNTAFGYPGGAIMPLYDAMYDYQDELNHILVRHEQGATHAAQGWARVKGEVGVVIATSGPGATNLITGIADAQIDSTPMVCITGQVFGPLLGTDAFQETDIIGISMPVTKWNIQVTKAEDIGPAIAKAFYIARTGRPGPVLIDITKDAQLEKFDHFEYRKCTAVRSYVPKPKLQIDQVEKAADLINNAKKPFLLIGQGVVLSQAENELIELAEKANIPINWTLLGISAVPTDHELAMGMVGMHGNYAPNVLTNDCDVLIAVGMRFDDRVTGKLNLYAAQAQVVHIELDPSEINKNIHAHAPVNADAKEALTSLLPLINEAKHTEWVAKFKELRAEEYQEVIHKDTHPTGDKPKMGEVIHLLNEASNGDAIIVTDVGQHQMITARYAKFNQTMSHVTSGGLGTMGFSLPTAMGAKMAQPDREVVAVIGDGGYQMTIQELGTIMQSNIGVKILVLNNNFLGMVRQWQEMFMEKRYAQTEMVTPDFVKIAEGYNIKAKKVTSHDNLKSTLEEFIAHKGSYFLEVVVERETNVFPMVPTGASVSDVRLK